MQQYRKGTSRPSAEPQPRQAGDMKKARLKRKIKIIAIVVIILGFLAGAIAYSIITPGKYDAFAKCLTEKGAVMYGEDWCPYTQGQKTMFGKSFKYVNYQVREGLKLRPTWVINGKTYERVQSFERLSALTGCPWEKNVKNNTQ